MTNSRMPRILFVSGALFAVGIAGALRALDWPSETAHPMPVSTPAAPPPIAAADGGGAPVAEPAAGEEPPAAPPSAASSELLALLHACMATPELRPSPESFPELDVDPRLLEDCLRGTESMRVLRELAAALPALHGQDREDAVLLVAYLARRMLASAPSTADKAEVLAPLIAGYRTIEGPWLASITGRLLSQAYYVDSDDRRGVAGELLRAFELELAEEPVPHVLGPLLHAAGTAAFMTEPLKALSADDPRSPKRAIAEMQKLVDRAIPVAIEAGLGALGSQSNPYELRDGLRLLQNAFLAGSDESETLLKAAPRVLDALADLDIERIKQSGVSLLPLDTLLAQTESRLRAAGALDANGVPVGGRTAPAELRRRWVIPEPPPGIRIVTPGDKLLQAPTFR